MEAMLISPRNLSVWIIEFDGQSKNCREKESWLGGEIHLIYEPKKKVKYLNKKNGLLGAKSCLNFVSKHDRTIQK